MVFLWSALILIAAIGISMALSFFLTRRHPWKVVASPLEYGLTFEEITFKTSDHLLLHGWWIPSDYSDRTIIFLHGYSGSMDPDLKYAPSFHQAGFNILMFDFRAHGRSEGKVTTLGALETRDVAAAIEYVRTRGSDQVGLLGFSMGGRTALLTAADGNQQISALVSDGAPLRLSFTINQQLKERGFPWGVRQLLTTSILLGASIRSGKNLFLADPIQITSLHEIPIFLIHAELDSYTNLRDLSSFVARIGKTVKLEVVSGVIHRDTDSLDFNDYTSRIITFFENSLSS